MSEYFKPNLKGVRQTKDKLDARSGGGSDYNWYKLEPGSHYLRILPPWSREAAEAGHVGLEVYRHYGLPDPANPTQQDRPHVCVRQMFPERGVACPVCDVIRAIEDEGLADMGRYTPSYKAYVNALIRKRLDPMGNEAVPYAENWTEETIYIVGLPTTMYSWILNTLIDPDAAGDITDPFDGYDIKITREGRTFSDTKYNALLLPKSQGPLHDNKAVTEAILGQLPKLDEIWKFPDAQIMQRIEATARALARKFSVPDNFQWADPKDYAEPSAADSEEEYEEEEPAPAAPPPPKAKKAKPAPEPEPEDEDDGTGEEAQDEDKPPFDGEVSTPADAVKALGIRPLDHEAVREGLDAGTPPCYGQWTRVHGVYPSGCEKRCAYEFACKEAEEEIAEEVEA